MKEIRNIAILGAGAMGAAYASKFCEVPEFSTALVAGGQRRERLKSEGLTVNGKNFSIPVIDPRERSAPADLIIVALKHHHLAGALEDLRHQVGPETIIMSVMNGLDSEEAIGAVYGMDKLLYAIAVGIDALRVDNRISFTNPGKIFFGEAVNREIGPKVRRLQAALGRAGLSHETPEDMIRMLWWKFMVNVGVNQAAAVMRAPYGILRSSPEARALMEALMGEVIALAKASEVRLTEKDVTEWYGFMETLSAGGKPSMLQDIEAGRKTEVEIFAGKAVQLGERLAIPTPVNRTILRTIKVLELCSA